MHMTKRPNMGEPFPYTLLISRHIWITNHFMLIVDTHVNKKPFCQHNSWLIMCWWCFHPEHCWNTFYCPYWIINAWRYQHHHLPNKVVQMLNKLTYMWMCSTITNRGCLCYQNVREKVISSEVRDLQHISSEISPYRVCLEWEVSLPDGLGHVNNYIGCVFAPLGWRRLARAAYIGSKDKGNRI